MLYNVSRDYDSAVPALREALRLRPEDHSLWNKLGATLANSNRSEEALPIYEVGAHVHTLVHCCLEVQVQ